MRVMAERVRSAFYGVVGACLIAGLLTGCGGSDSGGVPPPPPPPVSTVTGQVVSVATQQPVSGATVETKTGTTVVGKTTTAADGKFTVSAPVGNRTVVHVEANGFAEAFPVVSVSSGQSANLGVKLVPTGVTTVVAVSAGATVSVPNSPAQVTIPADGLVPKNGGTAAGSVNVSLTPINPAVDPNLMPGGFNGVSAGGSTVQPIESFGALLVDIRDGAGTPYNLAAGKTSTIRIPLGTQSANPPATIPLWYFDETAGVWKEEGTATLQGTAPNQYYEGTVAHFSYWNADQVLDRIFVNGCVKDANNQPVANAFVQTEGIDYTGIAIDFTAADGTFRVAIRKNSQAKLGLFEFDLQTFNFTPSSNTVTVGPSAVDITLANCLVKQPGPLVITTSALVGGMVGAAYSQPLAASGGVPGYVWSLNAGSNPLPNGITLNGTGLISGTPVTAGTTTITVKVTDSTGATKTKDFTLTIASQGVQALSIMTTLLPAGTVGEAYNAILIATGGTGTLSWSVIGGSLPTGLTLNPSTGSISGTPTTAGTSNVTVRVQDTGSPQQSAQTVFDLTITNVTPSCGTGATNCLTVTNAPASVGGKFTPTSPATRVSEGVLWQEEVQGISHSEGVEWFNPIPQGGLVPQIVFVSGDPGVGFVWACALPPGILGVTPCSGVVPNRSGGTITFTNTVLSTDGTGGPSSAPSITLNGTLTFTPF